MTNKNLLIVSIVIFFFAGILVYMANSEINKTNRRDIIINDNPSSTEYIPQDIKGEITTTKKLLEEAKNNEYQTDQKIKELKEQLQKENQKVKILSQDLELLFCREAVEEIDLTDPSTQNYWKDRMYTFCHDKDMIPLALRNDDIKISYLQDSYKAIDYAVNYPHEPIFSDEEIKAIAETTIYDEDYLYHVDEY